MSLLTTLRNEFINRYDRQKTQCLAVTALKAWDDFLATKNYNEGDLFFELRKPESKTRRYIILDQFVQFCKQDKFPTTIRTYFNYVKGWLKYNEVELDNDKIKTDIKFPKPVRDRVRGVDRTMIRGLIEMCNQFYKGLWYVLAYTAMRISEALNMKWAWIDFAVSPLKITIPGRYTKTGQERITFAGGEAEEWLRTTYEEQQKTIPKEKLKDEYVFAKNGKRISYFAAWDYFDRRRKKLGFVERGSNGFYHYRPHKYRGYAENKIGRGDGGAEFAHSILGHTKGLIEYNQSGATDEDARKDYESALPYLIISDEQRYKDENEKLKDQNAVIQEIKRKQELLEAFLESNPGLAKQFASFAKR